MNMYLFGRGKAEAKEAYVSGSFFGILGGKVISESLASQVKEPLAQLWYHWHWKIRKVGHRENDGL